MLESASICRVILRGLARETMLLGVEAAALVRNFGGLICRP